MSGFPRQRPRRLRRRAAIRALVRETELTPAHLVYPCFVRSGTGERRPIEAMPGIAQLSVDLLLEEVAAARAVGVPAVILFGIPAAKDAQGSEAYDPDGIVQRAVRALKDADPDTVVITDVCLCEYTDHGHCGLVEGDRILNDPTLELLAKTAASHAAAGADMVAPSDMMDGRVGAIRQRLDQEGYDEVAILSYAAKYCSAFYGPFRQAADSAPRFGDRRSHQMDPPNAREALKEVAMDIEEGADIVMVKPALPYLDVVRAVRESFQHPVAAYQVSGEYSMVMAAAQRGWLDAPAAMMESLTSIRRAGADLILTYWAVEAARQFHEA
ncbi:MAG: porphobilinogen synthase [Acidobacteriota bacterium]